jgi:hypothetical protein
MSSEQILSLISPLSSPTANNQELEVVNQEVESVNQENPAEDQKNQTNEKIDQEAGDILSVPEVGESDDKSNVLKTRKQLIEKITEICERRQENPKLLNLKRRRKRSLENILKVQFAEAAQKEMDESHNVHPELEKALPPGMEARVKFGVDMAFRLDLTICALLEKGVAWTDSWHGMCANGFAQSIEQNETLSSEIKACWEEILNEPENDWILESCTTTMRLFLCHMYGLMNVLKQKQIRQNYELPPMPPLRRQPREKIFTKEACENVVPPKSAGKLCNFARLRKARRKDDASQISLHSGAEKLVKSV